MEILYNNIIKRCSSYKISKKVTFYDDQNNNNLEDKIHLNRDQRWNKPESMKKGLQKEMTLKKKKKKLYHQNC